MLDSLQGKQAAVATKKKDAHGEERGKRSDPPPGRDGRQDNNLGRDSWPTHDGSKI